MKYKLTENKKIKMKYKLTENKKKIGLKTLYQIQALKSFSNVKKGDLGGWIEKESNLSQDGNAWVYGNAWVCGDARVCGNARVSGKIKLNNGFLCSRFDFEFKWQVDLWHKKEKEFEKEVEKRLKGGKE